MTVLTKPQLRKHEADPIATLHENEEDKVVITFADDARAAAEETSSRPWRGLLFFLVILSVVTMGMVVLTGLEYQRQAAGGRVFRFKGYCAIPIPLESQFEYDDQMLIEPNFFSGPMPWSAGAGAGGDGPGGDGPGGDGAGDGDGDGSLREELDIEDQVEKISVLSGPDGRPTTFVHDFGGNFTGIVSDSRCFLMELDVQSVLPPALFVLRIYREQGPAGAGEGGAGEGGEGGAGEAGEGGWGAGRLRRDVSVQFPALRQEAVPRALTDLCARRPTYRLAEENAIRKRSAPAAAAAHRYVHFAGRGVLELDVSNMDELRTFETHEAWAAA